MKRVGIDLEQFLVDPYGSGIQRVLQQLAIHWPESMSDCLFVLPEDDQFLLLNRGQAINMLSIPFQSDAGDPGEIRNQVNSYLTSFDRTIVGQQELVSEMDSWLLPEVSYLPSVHQRFTFMREAVPVAMIGFDTLPMTEPRNYRFRPGTAAEVSEYFRLLATADAVACISEFARQSLFDVLRRDRGLVTTVAHPGGDHVLTTAADGLETSKASTSDGPVFLRVGTLESRKRPVELVQAFELLALKGCPASLVMIGRPSASDESINRAVADVEARGVGVTWIRDAGDVEIARLMEEADAFLSFGTEGYGIPVLEALRLGTPVLFGGIQPAAELMEGSGAVRVNDGGPEAIADSLSEWVSSEALKSLRNEIDDRAIPTWADFAESVAAIL